MIRYVQYLTTASKVMEVDVPDDTPDDDVNETARRLADEKWSKISDVSLCHQCAGKMDHGDWDQDESDGGVWAP